MAQTTLTTTLNLRARVWQLKATLPKDCSDVGNLDVAIQGAASQQQQPRAQQQDEKKEQQRRDAPQPGTVGPLNLLDSFTIWSFLGKEICKLGNPGTTFNIGC